MIINERFARRFWPSYPGQDPIGQHISNGADKSAAWLEIVGVVSDVHEDGLAVNAGPEFYLPIAKHTPQTAYLAARIEGEPLGLVDAIRSQVQAIDRDQPISEVKMMQARFDAAVGQQRLMAMLLSSFAAVALLLAIIGIYGVIAYSVAQRTQEVGIRRALGAQKTDILWLLLRQGLGLVLAGEAVGIVGAFSLVQVMNRFLFGVKATDPAIIAGTAIVFLAVGLAASYIPARHAARIDPMGALRIG